MGMAAYAVIGGGGEWRIRHDGKSENVYQTKESAFEAAVAAASLAMKQGHEVQISVPGSETDNGSGKCWIMVPNGARGIRFSIWTFAETDAGKAPTFQSGSQSVGCQII
jgi:hypothetical protein